MDSYDFGLSDVGEAILQAEDGGFVICGGTNSIGAGQADVLLIRTDELGNLKWVKGDRIGSDLTPGVYFLMRKGEESDAHRVVKLR